MKQELAAIFLLWLALDIPVGIFIGKFIHFWNVRSAKHQAATAASNADA
jgi:hypothetical protein